MSASEQAATIMLEVTGPAGETTPIKGFSSLWVKYVDGFDSTAHCQRCLRGKRVEEASAGRLAAGHPVALDQMDRYPYVYVCGVSAGPESLRRERNLHLPLKYAPGQTVTVKTYNGYTITATNAVQLEIPKLDDGWQGLPPIQTRCKNFQFAVSVFGYPGI